MIKKNYQVSYEASCDPVGNVCFVGCDNDTCTETHYYAKMEKYAPDLLAECGTDITDCAAADSCLPGDQRCSTSYCDPTAVKEGEDQCETITDQLQLDELQQINAAEGIHQ